jgi:hypothetical protein
MNVRLAPWLAAAALAAALLPTRRVAAQDDPGAAPAAKPADIYEQTDRKKTMVIKLPRTWKPLPGEDIDERGAIAGFGGFYGEEKKSPNGAVFLSVLNDYTRAPLARSINLPQQGEVQTDAAREGPGWSEGCAVSRNAEWRRYVEKNGRVYCFQFLAAASVRKEVQPAVQKLLDTATIPGEYTPPSLGDNFKPLKTGAYDVLTDADADRHKSIAKIMDQMADARELLAKALPGKPVDQSRPVGWPFQNGSKYDDRAKIANGRVEWKESAIFSPVDRASLCSIISEGKQGFDQAVYLAGANHYVWQYFGGRVPLWLSFGLGHYGRNTMLGGGKGKLPPEVLSSAKQYAAAGKRRLDQWFDVTNGVDIDEPAIWELYAWQVYLRHGRGAKKYKKQLDAYVQTLHDKGDPVEARKAFDGVNFEEMLQDYKAWAAEWK